MTLYEIKQNLLSGKTIFDLPLKVAYYARVSTEKEEQINSLENQVSFFEDYIRKNKNWKFIRGYTDEGISGTTSLKRNHFMQMIEDSKKDEFDLIISKEVSRFSRDTIDSLFYTRKLLEYDVCVYFLSDNIITASNDGELRLTIMSSMAQDEVRKISERTKFGLVGAFIGGVITLSYAKLSQVGMSEIAVGIAFGPLLFEGVFFVMTKTFSLEVFILSLAVVMFTIGLLYVHTILDFEGDMVCHKKTLCCRLGDKSLALKGVWVIYSLAYLFTVILAFVLKNYFLFFTFILIPLIVRLYNSLGDYTCGGAPEDFYFRLLQARNLMVYYSILITLFLLF